MIEKKNKISIHQMQILMIFNILGNSLLIFPKLIAKTSNNSFVFSIILGLTFTSACTYLILYSLKSANAESFNDLFKTTFKPIFTKIIFILFLTKILCSITTTIIMFSNMTESILLPKTNNNIIILSFLLLSSYLCYKEQSVRAKTAQLIFYIFMLYILLFIIASMFNLKFDNLPNLLYVDSYDLAKGSIVTFLSFSSIIYFFFDYYYVEKKDTIIKSSLNVVLISGILFLFITVICVSTFTLRGIEFLQYPSFDTMSRLSIANSFITRNEAIVFIFWIFVIFTYITTGIFYGHLILSELIGYTKTNKKYYIVLIVSIIFILCKADIHQSFLQFIDYFTSFVLMFILPLLIILKHKIFIRKFSSSFILLLVPFLLTSCTDKIELEDRRFVYELYIDKDYDTFIMKYDYSQIDSTDTEKLNTLEVRSNSLLGCVNKAYMNNENSLDFRQIKSIILSDNILKDENMLAEVFDVLSLTNQVGNNTFVITYNSDSNDIFQENLTKEQSVSYFLENFLRNNKNNYITSINFDIDSILLKIRNEQTVIIPSISKEQTYEINGSTIVTDFQYNSFMDLDKTKGYAFLEKNANETPLEFNYNNKNTFVKVLSSDSDISFSEKNGKLIATYDIDVLAQYTQPTFEKTLNNNTMFLNLINAKIQTMCLDTFNYFVNIEVDGLYLKDKLMKKDIELYNKYNTNNKDFLKIIEPNIVINTKLDVSTIK